MTAGGGAGAPPAQCTLGLQLISGVQSTQDQTAGQPPPSLSRTAGGRGPAGSGEWTEQSAAGAAAPTEPRTPNPEDGGPPRTAVGERSQDGVRVDGNRSGGTRAEAAAAAKGGGEHGADPEKESKESKESRHRRAEGNREATVMDTHAPRVGAGSTRLGKGRPTAVWESAVRPTLSDCERDLIWERGLCRYN